MQLGTGHRLVASRIFGGLLFFPAAPTFIPLFAALARDTALMAMPQDFSQALAATAEVHFDPARGGQIHLPPAEPAIHHRGFIGSTRVAGGAVPRRMQNSMNSARPMRRLPDSLAVTHYWPRPISPPILQ
jgi:hypothetical protein